MKRKIHLMTEMEKGASFTLTKFLLVSYKNTNLKLFPLTDGIRINGNLFRKPITKTELKKGCHFSRLLNEEESIIFFFSYKHSMLSIWKCSEAHERIGTPYIVDLTKKDTEYIGTL